MPATHRVLTVHAASSVPVRLALLDAVEAVLQDHGATRIWIDPSISHELVVLAEFGEDGE